LKRHWTAIISPPIAVISSTIFLFSASRLPVITTLAPSLQKALPLRGPIPGIARLLQLAIYF